MNELTSRKLVSWSDSGFTHYIMKYKNVVWQCNIKPCAEKLPKGDSWTTTSFQIFTLEF